MFGQTQCKTRNDYNFFNIFPTFYRNKILLTENTVDNIVIFVSIKPVSLIFTKIGLKPCLQNF